MAEHSIKDTLSTVAGYIGEEVKDALDEKENIFRVDTMPVASEDNEGQIVQFTGATDIYTHGYYYECQEVEASDPTEYEWVNIKIQDDVDVTNKEDKFRFSIMPTASADWLGKTVEYTGTTTSNYIHSKRYECQVVPESDPTAYQWVEEVESAIDTRIGSEIESVKVNYDTTRDFRFVPIISIDLAYLLTKNGRTPTADDLTYASELLTEGKITQSEFKAVFDICPVPFATASDEMIKTVTDMYYDGTLSLNDIKSKWNLGDTRPIALSAMSASDNLTDTHVAQNVEMMIIGFDHNTLQTAVGGKSKALLSLQMKDCLLETGKMSTLSSQGIIGWANFERRSWSNTTFLNSLPSAMKSLVKPVSRQVNASGSYTTLETVVDSAFIPTADEMGGTSRGYGKGGTLYAYYNSDARRVKKVNGTASDYWTCSDIDNGGGYQICVGTIPSSGGTSLNRPYRYNPSGISMAFCI